MADPDDAPASEIEDVLDGLEQMPAVQQHAIEAARETAEADETQQAAVAHSVAGKTDNKGRPFDPKIHEVDALTGEPRLSKLGKLCVRRGRAYANSGGAQSTFSGPRPKSAASAQSSGIELEAKILATAQVTAETVFAVGMMVGGEEWNPRKDKETGLDERAAMTGAWAAYYRAQGITEIPPWLVLSMTLGSYAVPRFFMPQTRSRLQKAKEWLFAYMAKRKARGSFFSFLRSEEKPTSRDSVPMTP